MAFEGFPLFGTVFGVLAQVSQNARKQVFRRGRCCGRGGGCGRRSSGKWFGTGESEGDEVIVAVGSNAAVAQMGDEGIEAGVFGYDVKIAGGIECGGAADVVGQREVESVSARGGEADEFYRGGVFDEFLDEAGIELGLFCAEEEGEVDGFAFEEGKVHMMHVFEIDEDVVHGGREIGRGRGGRHRADVRPE
jgi:hypothetical protein